MLFFNAIHQKERVKPACFNHLPAMLYLEARSESIKTANHPVRASKMSDTKTTTHNAWMDGMVFHIYEVVGQIATHCFINSHRVTRHAFCMNRNDQGCGKNDRKGHRDDESLLHVQRSSG